MIGILVLATAILGLAQATPALVETVSSSPRAARQIPHRLTGLRHSRRDQTYEETATLDASFTDYTIFRLDSGTSVVCSTCYTKGQATARLSVRDGFDFGAVYDQLEESFGDAIDQAVEQVLDSVDDIDLDSSDLEIPPLDIDLNIDTLDLPDTVLELQLDELELYVDLDVTLAAGTSIRLNLYKTQGLGFQLTSDLFLGLIFSIDLLLSIDSGEVTLSSGFHVKLNDGILMRLALFATETPDFDFNGGQFEFLPVEVASDDGFVLSAILQLSLRTGFSIFTADVTEDGGFLDEFGDEFGVDGEYSTSAGIETRVYANVAELLTRVIPSSGECVVNIIQEYTFAIGGAAGASVGLGQNIYGPTPSTEIDVFSTTLPELCLTEVGVFNDAPNPTGSTTLACLRTYSAEVCATEGFLCPASLATFREVVATETFVADSCPTPNSGIVSDTIDFGIDTRDIPSGGDEANGGDDELNLDLVIGLSVGLGVPFLVGIIVSIIFCCRRKKKDNDPQTQSTTLNKANATDYNREIVTPPMTSAMDASSQFGPRQLVTNMVCHPATGSGCSTQARPSYEQRRSHSYEQHMRPSFEQGPGHMHASTHSPAHGRGRSGSQNYSRKASYESVGGPGYNPATSPENDPAMSAGYSTVTGLAHTVTRVPYEHTRSASQNDLRTSYDPARSSGYDQNTATGHSLTQVPYEHTRSASRNDGRTSYDQARSSSHDQSIATSHTLTEVPYEYTRSSSRNDARTSYDQTRSPGYDPSIATGHTLTQVPYEYTRSRSRSNARSPTAQPAGPAYNSTPTSPYGHSGSPPHHTRSTSYDPAMRPGYDMAIHDHSRSSSRNNTRGSSDQQTGAVYSSAATPPYTHAESAPYHVSNSAYEQTANPGYETVAYPAYNHARSPTHHPSGASDFTPATYHRSASRTSLNRKPVPAANYGRPPDGSHALPGEDPWGQE